MQSKYLDIEESIREDEGLAKAVERATGILTEEIGPSAGDVGIAWRRSERDPRMIEVEISYSDEPGVVDSIAADFRPDELQVSSGRLGQQWSLQRRLRQMWGDLLQSLSHKQLERLRSVVREIGDE